MPHDMKGRLVEVGDVVKGRGYNVKHEIVGPVVRVHAAVSCNLEVAHPVVHKPGSGVGGVGFFVNGLLVQLGIEYGQTDAFEIVQKADGSAPPEAPPQGAPAEL